MRRTRVKMCGMMRPEDAAAAVSLGADAIGLILHPPARRHVSPERAREILAAAMGSPAGPFVTCVGIFVDAPSQHILETARALGLSTVQLHGHETPDEALPLADAGLRLLKAIRLDEGAPRTLDLWRLALPRLSGRLAGLVLETPNTSGGSGLPNDWAAAKRLRDAGAFDGLPPLIAAGGLSPDTVAGVIHLLRPAAVDVSSGVEDSPGLKSPAKMAAFLAAVRSADEDQVHHGATDDTEKRKNRSPTNGHE